MLAIQVFSLFYNGRELLACETMRVLRFPPIDRSYEVPPRSAIGRMELLEFSFLLHGGKSHKDSTKIPGDQIPDFRQESYFTVERHPKGFDGA